MLNITKLAEELHELTKWQETPTPLTQPDYVRMVVRGIKRFFVDINHPTEYNITSFTTNDDGDTVYDRDFLADEEIYIMCLCKIEFFQTVQTDVNGMFSYSTDALTVTNADKPYANLKNTIEGLEYDRRIIFNKMVRYTLSDV